MHVTAFEAVFALFAAAVAFIAWDERRQQRRRREHGERMAARHDPPQNHAWGPGTTTPPQPTDIDLWEREISE